MNNKFRKMGVIAIVLALVLTPLAGPLMAVGPVEADVGEDGCADDIVISAIAPMSIGYIVYDNAIEPCWEDKTGIQEDEVDGLTTNQTYEKTLNVVNVRSNEERLIDSLLNTPEFSKSPVRSGAELEMAYYYANTAPGNRTETEFVSTARDYINKKYDKRVHDLVLRYNRDLRSAENTYSRLQTANATNLIDVYVDGSEVDTSGGISFSIPTNQNDTTNGTEVTISEDVSVRAGTVTVDNTTYDYRDDLSIRIVDPAGKSDPVPIVGQDVRKGEVGADNYEPSISPADADIVVDVDGSGDYTSLESASANATEGDTIYIKEGAYDSDSIVHPPANTTWVANNATSETTDNGGFINLDENSTNVVVAGFTVESAEDVAYGSPDAAELTLNHFTVEGTNTLLFGEATFTLKNSYIVNYNEFHDVGVIGHDPIIENSYGHGSSLPAVWSSFTLDMIDEQESDRTEILNAYGTTESGYASDVWTDLETGTLDITDILTYEQMFSDSFSEDDVGSIHWINAQYLQAGMAGNVSATTTVEVQSGSTVYANAREDQANTLDSDKTYKGTLWTNASPPSGVWETNQTYDTADLGGKVFVVYYDQQEYVEDGSVVVETVPKSIAIEGEFRITDIKTQNGTSIDSAETGDSANVDPYNSSEYADEIERLNNRIDDLIDEIKNDDDGAGGGSGVCGIEVFGFCSGISVFQISIVGAILVGIPVLYLLRPMFSMGNNLSK